MAQNSSHQNLVAQMKRDPQVQYMIKQAFLKRTIFDLKRYNPDIAEPRIKRLVEMEQASSPGGCLACFACLELKPETEFESWLRNGDWARNGRWTRRRHCKSCKDHYLELTAYEDSGDAEKEGLWACYDCLMPRKGDMFADAEKTNKKQQRGQHKLLRRCQDCVGRGFVPRSIGYEIVVALPPG